MLDTHTHILPNIDDGAVNLSTTIDMINESLKEGRKEIIATPHYCIGYAETQYKKVKSLVRVLNSYLKKKKIDAQIYPGQEIYYTDNIIKDYDNGVIGTINDSKYILIEFPLEFFSENAFSVLYELKYKGLEPVIAHPERYEYIIDNKKLINEFIDEGYLFQLNSGSLEGEFGYRVKRTAKKLVKHRIYSFIGSDAHNCKSRTIKMNKSLKFIIKRDKEYYKLLEENNYKLIKNDIIRFSGERI